MSQIHSTPTKHRIFYASPLRFNFDSYATSQTIRELVPLSQLCLSTFHSSSLRSVEIRVSIGQDPSAVRLFFTFIFFVFPCPTTSLKPPWVLVFGQAKALIGLRLRKVRCCRRQLRFCASSGCAFFAFVESVVCVSGHFPWAASGGGKKVP